MTAPFDLPDTCDIHLSPTSSTVLASNVPCRQVPNFAVGMNGRQPTAADGWSHWVDFNPDVAVVDGASYVAPFQQLLGVGNGLIFLSDDLLLILEVVWVEDRYTNTDRAYTRCYCQRTLRQI